jgi:hypothetical protein
MPPLEIATKERPWLTGHVVSYNTEKVDFDDSSNISRSVLGRTEIPVVWLVCEQEFSRSQGLNFAAVKETLVQRFFGAEQVVNNS